MKPFGFIQKYMKLFGYTTTLRKIFRPDSSFVEWINLMPHVSMSGFPAIATAITVIAARLRLAPGGLKVHFVACELAKAIQQRAELRAFVGKVVFCSWRVTR